ncbi:uncharacterized protein LOC134209855 [Armigeres subalbatus]|uniref:uncharacterized protein LOC134209855 n=1 Tax=Armigeres subalbatus TaxID=124917 RepID=UPI002ED4F3AD
MATKLDKMLAECMVKRKAIFITRAQVEKFVAKFDAAKDTCQIPVRLETLDRIYKEFLEVQSDIECYDKPETLDIHFGERADFETRYCEAKGFLLSKRSTEQNQTLMNSTMHSDHQFHAAFHLRLPKIDLPKFNGDFSRWLSFRDTFTSMVHSNADIPTELHNLVDDYQRHVKALGKLNEPIQYWDTPLINLLSYKLDPTTLRAWEESTSSEDNVSYERMVDFLYQRARMLKSVVTDLQQRSQQPISAKVAGSIPFPKKPFKMAANTVVSKPYSSGPQCIACSEKHFLFLCPVFAKMSVAQRRELVSQKHLCWNCFKSGHLARSCTSKFTCRTCHDKHHSLLHQEALLKISSTPAISPQQPIQQPSTSTAVEPARHPNQNPQVSLSVQSSRSTVLLETVDLLVLDQNGKKHSARALLDSASMCNFMTKKLVNFLNIRRKTVNIAVTGAVIGESKKQIKFKLTATIQSKFAPFSTALEFLTLKKPTINLPTIPVDISQWKLPEVSLADPKFHIPAGIDMIVGGEAYHELHTGGKVPLGEGLPTLIETVFGWTVSGKVSIKSANVPHVCHLTTVDRNLEQALQRFWELEAIDSNPVLSTEETYCEEFYSATTTRDSSGRYLVRLPLTRDPLVTLGTSRLIAERRFLNLEKRLERDPPTKDAYCSFMDEYERLAHMRRFDDPADTIPHCYLPHHPVFKASSTSTKVRVVFDASCKTTSGFSVNDMQLVGPVVQEDLLSIVMRFRTHQIAIVADCEKMYRQVLLHQEDRPFQRILWRSSPYQPLATYELQTVTYEKVLAVEAVKQDFYVDDFLSGADDLPSAIRLRKQVYAMLSVAGFPLKKWASNVPEALADVSEEDHAIELFHDLQNEQSVSVLGLVWELESDFPRFKVQLPLPVAVLTKLFM